MEKKRFRESRESIWSFFDEFLVICPRCENLAAIKKISTETDEFYTPRRLACFHCGHTKDWQPKTFGVRITSEEPPVDIFFGLPLFLTAQCGGHTFWAFNLQHLKLIEDYVLATLRQHVKDEKYGWNNRGVVNRLPRWMTAANNREKVLKTINDLKLRLQTVS